MRDLVTKKIAVDSVLCTIFGADDALVEANVFVTVDHVHHMVYINTSSSKVPFWDCLFQFLLRDKDILKELEWAAEFDPEVPFEKRYDGMMMFPQLSELRVTRKEGESGCIDFAVTEPPHWGPYGDKLPTQHPLWRSGAAYKLNATLHISMEGKLNKGGFAENGIFSRDLLLLLWAMHDGQDCMTVNANWWRNNAIEIFRRLTFTSQKPKRVLGYRYLRWRPSWHAGYNILKKGGEE